MPNQILQECFWYIFLQCINTQLTSFVALLKSPCKLILESKLQMTHYKCVLIFTATMPKCTKTQNTNLQFSIYWTVTLVPLLWSHNQNTTQNIVQRHFKSNCTLKYQTHFLTFTWFNYIWNLQHYLRFVSRERVNHNTIFLILIWCIIYWRTQ